VAPLLTALLPILRGARITVREAISSYGLSSTGSRLDALLSRLAWLSRVLALAISNAFRNWSRLLLTQLALGGAGSRSLRCSVPRPRWTTRAAG
jgi:putative ABC transport system permease protein